MCLGTIYFDVKYFQIHLKYFIGKTFPINKIFSGIKCDILKFSSTTHQISTIKEATCAGGRHGDQTIVRLTIVMLSDRQHK